MLLRIMITLTLFLALVWPACAAPRADSKQDDKLWSEVARPVKNPNISWSEIIERSKGAVVLIEAVQSNIDLLQPFRPPLENINYGSGFFIDRRGYILTNNHVISRVKKINILTANGLKKFDADLVGTCDECDLALLKLKDEEMKNFIEYNMGLTILALSDSDSVKEGENILSLGYPFATANLTFTEGIISGFTRKGMEPYQYIQTNSALNKGNSGGPSLDKNGAVIGINNAIIEKAQNIGFMIPINNVKLIIPQLVKGGDGNFPSMGIDWILNDENTAKYLKEPDGKGIIINTVVPDGTADKAGLKKMDILTGLGGIDIDFYGEGVLPQNNRRMPFESIKNRFSVGSQVPIKYCRDGKVFEKKIIFHKLPDLPIRYIRKDEEPDYEIWGGMVLQQLNLDVVELLKKHKLESATFLEKYTQIEERLKPKVIITYIFQNSQAQKSRKLQIGQLVETINGRKIATLGDVRKFVDDPAAGEFLVVETTDGTIAALNVESVKNDEPLLRATHRYTSNRPLKTADMPRKTEVK
jgi:S1-C subfamily serine protease